MKKHSPSRLNQLIAVSVTLSKCHLQQSMFANVGFISALCFSFSILVVAGCKKKPAAPPPPEVQIITLAATNVPIFEEWIGTLDGFVNAQIRAQVSGYLLTQNYTEGSAVKTGDVLFKIDPRPLQAALDQTLAKLAQDQAQAGKTELDVKRFTPLAKEQAISQEQLDNAVQADIGAKALVKSDEAAIENAQLNLGFTKIKSPIDGLAGIALAQIGDLLSPSSGLLTTVSTINPIKVYFQISEQSYLNFWRHHAAGSGAETNLELELVFADGSIYAEKGRFLFADRQINPTTGTLQIVGLFSNADFLLRPGQYGRVRAQTLIITNALLVPQRAVTELQGTFQVAVVGETNQVHLQPVKVGEQVGANWIIESGLKPGERIVVEGAQKVKEGAVVNPKPFGSETNQAGARTNSAMPSNPPK
jgi:membrane fusion protein (multidrug efflux system)